MLRKLTFLLGALCVIFTTTAVAQVGQGALKGKIVNKETGEAVPFANVVLESGGIQVGGATSDFDGNYTIKPVPPGTYTLKSTYVGFANVTITDVRITGDKTTYYDIEMSQGEGIELEGVEVVYHQNLVDKDNMTTGQTLTREDIERLPVRSVTEIQGLSVGVVAGQIRGTRAGASQTFIDGIKVIGSTSLPRAAIGEVNVITGGVPAQYGDLTGGVTSITTRGPSAQSFTAIEVLTSGFKKNNKDEVFGFDNQGYNLIGLTYGGPLLFERDEEGNKKKPLIGFLISSEFISVVDPRPSIVGKYQAKEDVIDRLQADPLRETGTGTGSIPNASYLRMDDLKKIETRRNVGRRDINLNGNLDFVTSKNTSLKFGATFTTNDGNYDVDNNVPGEAFSLLNFENNPNQINTTWRAYGRFTQSFNNELDENTSSSASIKNAYVSFQVDYTRDYSKTQNANHKDNFFDYGYIGRFDYFRITDQISNYALRTDTLGDGTQILGYFYEGPNLVQIDYTPGDKNPVLANFTSDYYSLYVDTAGNPVYPGNYDRVESIRNGGGLLNGDVPRDIYAMWTDVGYQYNNYSIDQAAQFRVTANGSADIGNHAVLLGFEYEQRDERRYSLAPRELWNRARQLMNTHLSQLDRNNYTIDYRFGPSYPAITFQPLYDESSQATFDKNVREALGLPVDGLDFIDVDSYDPSLFKVDYFSADELLNGGSPLVSYNGYDHTGKKTKGRSTIDDFFNERDEDGNFTRAIPSFQPIYVAGYIQDRFDFDDLVFRVGVRVDRFDANQPVLKDPYSLFETIKAGNAITGGNHPSNIGDDFVVYVSDVKNPSPDNIIGYRDLNGNDIDIWYNAEGEEIANPTEEIVGPDGLVTPWLVDTDDDKPEEDLTSSSFQDYTPQVNVMPRISFSFPISDEANFYANYDVLTQRPTSSLRMDPIDYLFMGTRNQVFSNPDLKPVKQITYELGFEQLLTRSSSISYSAFYREQRDDIQVVRRLGAYPVSYRTFENIDFGTVKGLSVEYDMRRIKNIRVIANYTLQFAEGTGSSSTSQLNLINNNDPNLRTIQPTSNDRRHTINLITDYFYATGKDYNGPVIGGKDVLAGAGITFTTTAGSGTPYSKSSVITSGGLYSGGFQRRLDGGINGSRLPWTVNIDMRIDKNFNVKLGESKKNNTPRMGVLNVYVQVLNLLNTQNVRGVYDGTGSPEDDGYLSEPTSQQSIRNQYDPQSFRDLYTAKILNDGFYDPQRRIRLGLQLSF